jgi:hypothetical protein
LKFPLGKGTVSMSLITHEPPPAIVPPAPVRRFTVNETHEMIRTEALGEDDAVDLLEGRVEPRSEEILLTTP